MSSFRPAVNSDMDSIIELMRNYYSEDGYSFDEVKATEALSKLILDKTLGHIWVVEIKNQIVGYLAVTLGYSLEYQGRDAFIDELYLEPASRGAGLGKEAIAISEDYCRRNDVKALHLEVERHRKTAQDIYRSNGFKDNDRHLMTKWL